MKNIRKQIIVLGILLCGMSVLSAQQHITNFGIVDTEKVYDHFFRNSSAIKNYENKKNDIQNEINKKTQELRDLKAQKDLCDEVGDKTGSDKLSNQIRDKSEFLRDYTTSKKLELQNLKKSLSESNQFYIKLSKTIKRVAENEGLSMVLSLQGESAILWYSQSVDITEKVISELEK